MDNSLNRSPIDRRTLLSGLGAGLLAGISASAVPAVAAEMLTINGEITYHQRVALPRDAVAIIDLRPADLPEDAPPLAELIIELDGAQVPIAFAIEARRALLQSGDSYVIRAGIRVGAELRWLSRPAPVDIVGDTLDIGTLILQPFRTLSPYAGVEYGDLEGGDWAVVELDGAPISAGSEPTIGFADAGSFHGSACNRFRGRYSLDGSSIDFGDAAATMMACPDPLMTGEQSLFGALSAAKQASISPDGKLVLSDADGKVVLRARRLGQ